MFRCSHTYASVGTMQSDRDGIMTLHKAVQLSKHSNSELRVFLCVAVTTMVCQHDVCDRNSLPIVIRTARRLPCVDLPDLREFLLSHEIQISQTYS